ncbi:MAG: DUF541 domain-containing protein [Clostridiales bacterium]|nr:DUF541 domain-containing protein [Clostridiales bacterium]
MNKQILKRTVALGCLTLALFCVVKTEEGSKKPIIMKQMAVAEEVVEFNADSSLSVEESETVEMGKEFPFKTEENITKDFVDYSTNAFDTTSESEVVEYQLDDELSVMVVGCAKVKVAPDSAVIKARIETLEGDIDASKESALEIFDNVTSSLLDKGLTKENVKLDCFNCFPCYEFSLAKSISGYSSSCTMSIEVVQMDSLQEYIDVLTENGITSIENICYKVADMDLQYNTALTSAIENAKNKAQAIAGEGLSLVNVKEESLHCSNFFARCCSDVKLADYVGEVEIEARVVAVFEK